MPAFPKAVTGKSHGTLSSMSPWPRHSHGTSSCKGGWETRLYSGQQYVLPSLRVLVFREEQENGYWGTRLVSATGARQVLLTEH